MGKVYGGNNNGISCDIKAYLGNPSSIANDIKVYMGDENGIAREIYSAYNPPTFSDVTVNSVYLDDENLRLAGTVISLSDLAVPLSHGYTRFKCTISGEVDALDRGMLYVGISANGNDVYGGPAYDFCGSYHNGTGSSSKTVTFSVNLDIASLISTYGSSGTIQFGYRANDYLGYTPDIFINASMTNIYLSKT